jgi:hypothetical protein
MQSFGDQLRTSDKDIIEFGSHLKDLVGEDQINAAKQLVDMEKSREDQVKPSGRTSSRLPNRRTSRSPTRRTTCS